MIFGNISGNVIGNVSKKIILIIRFLFVLVNKKLNCKKTLSFCYKKTPGILCIVPEVFRVLSVFLPSAMLYAACFLSGS